ncbi:hypothetical protein Q3H58_003568 [Pseudomonas psychrotolerans]|nr:hypothetical protein [Pseudomonas psychrotolerans]
MHLGELAIRGGGAGQGGVVQFDAQPGEQTPADVALELQVDVGLVARQLADLVLVVVGVDQVGEGEAYGDQQEQQADENDTQHFGESFHGEEIPVPTGDGTTGQYKGMGWPE